ncbi:MAG: TM2 domain-containing protein [Candidatus Poseidoniaceae archaeon]
MSARAEQNALTMQPQQQPQYVQAVHQPVVMAQPAMVAPVRHPPSAILAYVLWFFLGLFGIHHLYMGRGVGVWLLSLVTLQGLGFWWLIDLFLIPSSCSKVRGGMVVMR